MLHKEVLFKKKNAKNVAVYSTPKVNRTASMKDKQPHSINPSTHPPKCIYHPPPPLPSFLNQLKTQDIKLKKNNDQQFLMQLWFIVLWILTSDMIWYYY